MCQSARRCIYTKTAQIQSASRDFLGRDSSDLFAQLQIRIAVEIEQLVEILEVKRSEQKIISELLDRNLEKK